MSRAPGKVVASQSMRDNRYTTQTFKGDRPIGVIGVIVRHNQVADRLVGYRLYCCDKAFPELWRAKGVNHNDRIVCDDEAGIAGPAASVRYVQYVKVTVPADRRAAPLFITRGGAGGMVRGIELYLYL